MPFLISRWSLISCPIPALPHVIDRIFFYCIRPALVTIHFLFIADEEKKLYYTIMSNWLQLNRLYILNGHFDHLVTKKEIVAYRWEQRR